LSVPIENSYKFDLFIMKIQFYCLSSCDFIQLSINYSTHDIFKFFMEFINTYPGEQQEPWLSCPVKEQTGMVQRRDIYGVVWCSIVAKISSLPIRYLANQNLRNDLSKELFSNKVYRIGEGILSANKAKNGVIASLSQVFSTQ